MRTTTTPYPSAPTGRFSPHRENDTSATSPSGARRPRDDSLLRDAARHRGVSSPTSPGRGLWTPTTKDGGGIPIWPGRGYHVDGVKINPSSTGSRRFRRRVERFAPRSTVLIAVELRCPLPGALRAVECDRAPPARLVVINKSTAPTRVPTRVDRGRATLHRLTHPTSTPDRSAVAREGRSMIASGCPVGRRICRPSRHLAGTSATLRRAMLRGRRS